MIYERAVVVALAVVASSPAAMGDEVTSITEAAPEGASIDWTRGLLIERASGAADIRAPSAAVARVGSHREALAAAKKRLGARARALVLADGTSVSAAEAADAQVAARLARAVDRTLELRTVYSTDGSVMMWAGLPLEAVRQAVVGARVVSDAGTSPIASIIVDATAIEFPPAVGISVAVGAASYQGPTVFAVSLEAAAADPRLGVRSVAVTAERYENGVLVLAASGALDATTLSEARATGALVVVVLGT